MLGFDTFSSMFMIVFVIILILIIASAIVSFYRTLHPPVLPISEPTPVVKEREIIREIVKIRCPYCNNLYEEKYDKCPYCGGKRTP